MEEEEAYCHLVLYQLQDLSQVRFFAWYLGYVEPTLSRSPS